MRQDLKERLVTAETPAPNTQCRGFEPNAAERGSDGACCPSCHSGRDRGSTGDHSLDV